MLLELLSSPEAWTALIMLTAMEIVLGIDNIIFISILANKLPEEQQPKARSIGLLMAFVLRVLLLFSISWIMQMDKYILFEWGELPPLKEAIEGHAAHIAHGPAYDAYLDADKSYLGLTGKSLILLLGGLFLMYKSVKEIHHKLDIQDEKSSSADLAKHALGQVIFQIVLMDLVFSFDSILTAVGLTSDLGKGTLNPLPVMVAGMFISMIVMLLFAGPVGRFVNKHPSIQVLGLSFLILIGFMLVGEAGHACKLHLWGAHIEPIPKGYLYFAISFSLVVELLNIRSSKKTSVQLEGYLKEAKEMDLYGMKEEEQVKN